MKHKESPPAVYNNRNWNSLTSFPRVSKIKQQSEQNWALRRWGLLWVFALLAHPPASIFSAAVLAAGLKWTQSRSCSFVRTPRWPRNIRNRTEVVVDVNNDDLDSVRGSRIKNATARASIDPGYFRSHPNNNTHYIAVHGINLSTFCLTNREFLPEFNA